MAHAAANSAVIYDSTSDAGESDASTCEEGHNSMGRLSIMARVRSLQQENTVLKIEVDTLKLRCKNLKEENEELRRARVNLQARAEQEEEYISNTLLRKIQSLKKEKEVLATTYEQEEEFLTNELSRKLAKLREEKLQLETTLEVEQQNQIGRLMKKIEKLEQETSRKQAALEQLRRDKVDLENYLEQEQEQLVNKLWKQMDDLEKQKQDLITQLQDRQSHQTDGKQTNSDTSANNKQPIMSQSNAMRGPMSPNERINVRAAEGRDKLIAIQKQKSSPASVKVPGSEKRVHLDSLEGAKEGGTLLQSKSVGQDQSGIRNVPNDKIQTNSAVDLAVVPNQHLSTNNATVTPSAVSLKGNDSLYMSISVDTNDEDVEPMGGNLDLGTDEMEGGGGGTSAQKNEGEEDNDMNGMLGDKVDELRSEVSRLKKQLKLCQIEHARRLEEVSKEEVALRAEKLLLERKLAREKERSDALNKQLSESESSLEIDDERHFNESRKSASSPIPVIPGSPLHHRSISGGLNIQVGSPVGAGAVLPPGSTGMTPGGSSVGGGCGSVGTGGVGGVLIPTKCLMCGTVFAPQPPAANTPGSCSVSSYPSVGGGTGSNLNTPGVNLSLNLQQQQQPQLQQHPSVFFPSSVVTGSGGGGSLVAGLMSPNNANLAFTPHGAPITQQRSRLVSGSSSCSQKSPRGSLLNESSGSGHI
ncbi:uncharacterized protein LOC142345854 isoform X2 [Convolutriloba macropyga]|uniref:uncharacterized protein LOC142345854 isoform X2 n=1 Tax=Convolutriloba macropyga TaxID=536237 RepID=UPI003F5202DF